MKVQLLSCPSCSRVSLCLECSVWLVAITLDRGIPSWKKVLLDSAA